MPTFTEKVVIVTGSSNGIGRTTALQFAKEGAKVTITGRNAERLEETRQVILKAGIPAANVHSVVGDITLEDVQSELVSSTIAKFGRLDVLVNNAGASIADKEGKIGIDQDLSIYDKIFNTNVRSIIGLTQKARPHLAASKGEIVNVSSNLGGQQAQPHSTYYAMSKSALDQLTRSMAIYLIPEGIRVNSVSPGITGTGFLGAMGLNDEMSQKLYDFFGSHKECVPTGATGKPEDISEVIVFLADRKKSGYILGQSIVADGGMTLIMGANVHDIGSMIMRCIAFY